MSRTLRLGAIACLWSLPTVVMAQAAGGVQAGGFGGRELILIAAITLLMAGVSRLPGFIREEAWSGGGASSSRAYLDSLLGLAQSPGLGRRADKDRDRTRQTGRALEIEVPSWTAAIAAKPSLR